MLTGAVLCPPQPRGPGQPPPGKALVENLCMKAVNQSIGRPGTVPGSWDAWQENGVTGRREHDRNTLWGRLV